MNSNSEELLESEVSNKETNMRDLGLVPSNKNHVELYMAYVKAKIRAVIDKTPMPSKRRLFKLAHGISKTRVQLMRKHGLDWTSAEDVNVYKDKLKIKREKQRKIEKEKLADSRLWRRTKGKVRKSKHKKRTKGWQSGTRKAELTLG